MTNLERVKSHLKQANYCLRMIEQRAAANEGDIKSNRYVDDCRIGLEHLRNALALLEKEGESDGTGTDSGTAVRSGDATDDD